MDCIAVAEFVCLVGCIVIIFYLRRNIRKRIFNDKRNEVYKINTAQLKLLDIAKWIESEKVHHDVGATPEERDKFIMNWILEHSNDVRDAWNRSKCRSCFKECYHNLREECSEYIGRN
jgi:hypothetical protein